jgi:hypothetical protein
LLLHLDCFVLFHLHTLFPETAWIFEWCFAPAAMTAFVLGAANMCYGDGSLFGNCPGAAPMYCPLHNNLFCSTASLDTSLYAHRCVTMTHYTTLFLPCTEVIFGKRDGPSPLTFPGKYAIIHLLAMKMLWEILLFDKQRFLSSLPDHSSQRIAPWLWARRNLADEVQHWSHELNNKAQICC